MEALKQGSGNDLIYTFKTVLEILMNLDEEWTLGSGQTRGTWEVSGQPPQLLRVVGGVAGGKRARASSPDLSTCSWAAVLFQLVKS